MKGLLGWLWTELLELWWLTEAIYAAAGELGEGTAFLATKGGKLA